MLVVSCASLTHGTESAQWFPGEKSLGLPPAADPLNECPPPVKKWEQCGMPDPVYDMLKKLELKCPGSMPAAVPPSTSCRPIAWLFFAHTVLAAL
jgi:hypothetical protein